jgi:hypothetical protein
MSHGIAVTSIPPITDPSILDIYFSLKKNYPMPEGPTDKWEIHSYLPVYESVFKDTRNTHTKLLEIGSFTGGSLCIWQEFFKDYEIHSIDIFEDPLAFSPHKDNPMYGQPSPFERRLKDDPNMHLHHGRSSMDPIVAQGFQDNYFDYITEDGDHTLNGQYTTFKLYWEKLKPGGYYFIEDIRGEKYADILAWMCRAWVMDDDLSFVNTRKDLKDIQLYNGTQKTGRGDDIMLIFRKGFPAY